MTTLQDRLRDFARDSIEARETAFSTHKDPDDAESYLESLIEELVENYSFDINSDLSRYLGDK